MSWSRARTAAWCVTSVHMKHHLTWPSLTRECQGFEAAIKFAKLGADTLILGVRTPAKGEAAKAEIVAASGMAAGAIAVMQVDYTSFDSISAFAVNVKKEVPRLDIALLNAGIGRAKFSKTADGWEETLQVNTLATALLAVELLPKLRESAAVTGQAPHLSIVTSEAYTAVTPGMVRPAPGQSLLEHANDPKNFGIMSTYSVSKLFAMGVQRGIVEAMDPRKPTDPIVVTVCPGMCRTNIVSGGNALTTLIMKSLWVIAARTAEQGSRSLVSSTLLGDEGHGQFWSDDAFFPLLPKLDDAQFEEIQAKAWEEIWQVLKQHKPDLSI